MRTDRCAEYNVRTATRKAPAALENALRAKVPHLNKPFDILFPLVNKRWLIITRGSFQRAGLRSRRKRETTFTTLVVLYLHLITANLGTTGLTDRGRTVARFQNLIKPLKIIRRRHTANARVSVLFSEYISFYLDILCWNFCRESG